MYFSGWSNCLIFPRICAIFLNLDQLSNLKCAHPCFVFSSFSWMVCKLVSGHPKVHYPNWFQVIPKYPPRPLSLQEKCSCLLLFVTKRKNGRSPPLTLWYQKFEKFPQNISKITQIYTKKIQKIPNVLLILFLATKENTRAHTHTQTHWFRCLWFWDF
jgi:hypothetical protein